MATFRFLRHTPGLDMNIVGTSSPRPAICWLATWLRWASSWANDTTSTDKCARLARHRTRQYGSFVGPIVAQKCDQKRPWTLSSTKKKNILLHLGSVSLIRVRHSWTPFPLQAAESESCKDSDKTRSPGVPMVELMDSSHLRYHNELCWIWTRNQIASLTSLTYFTPPRGLGLVEALRIFLATFRLPGEAN